MKTEKKKIILIVLIAFVVYGYAFAGQTIYVDADAAGANDGSSWADAYNYLQDALFNALPSTEIRVAQGIYKPHLNSYSAQPPSREDTFQLKNGIILIGGFAGFGEPDPDARDIGAYETLLSGDLNANDPEVKDACDLIADPCRADNCYHVVTGSLDSAITVLDGFTITGGNANWEPPWPYDHRMKGGGMYCSEGSSTTVANCLFHDNSAIWGGGMYIGVGSPILTNCTFRANAAERHAGALEIECAYMPIINHAFIGNFAGVNGGAVWNFDTAPVYVNCIFSGNKAGGDGGAMWNVDSSNYTLINCTFANNTAAGLGGAIDSDEWPILTNCILWSNRDVSGMGELAHVHAYHGPSAINYCCVQGWTGVLGGTGNIGDDPFFVDTDGIDDIVGTEDDNLRLLADSPCIDAGDNSVVTITTDLDGNPRIVNGSVDMGAYEYQGPFKQCYYVDGINGDDNNDGLSPETAFATIQKGIDSTQNGDLVIVLPGTYTGPGNRDIDFKGKAITVCGENGPNNCIVDCEAQGRGFYFHRGENADSLLEGLTIMNGSIQNMGAGIFCVGTSPSIRNCIIRNCSILGTGAGGGISCDGGGLAIINCTIIDNTAFEGGGIYLLNCSTMINSCTISRNGNYSSWGGGIYCRDSSLTVTGCTITENNGYSGGGGMYCKYSSSTVTDCTITENNGGNGGGGMYCEYGSLSITDCNFVQNEADYGGGGGVKCAGCNVAVSRCTFSENGTDADYSDGGGAVYFVRTGGTIANCSFIDNETIGGLGAGILCADQSSPVISNCSFVSHRDDVVTCSDGSNPIIRDCSFTENWGTPIDISGSAPMVSNCEIVDNYMMAIETGGACSPLIVNCRITGNAWGGVWIKGGSPTIVNCTIADNHQYAGMYCLSGEVTICNSIIWDNTIWTGDPISILLENGAVASVSYSDVQGGWPGVSNIDADPRFVDPNGGDYRVLSDSPCIDAGDNSAVPPSVLTDLDGNLRIIGDKVDMGAYEFTGPIYVDDDAPNDPGPDDPGVSDPLENGTEAHPFDTIQEGINVAKNGYTVLVRMGSYLEPDSGNSIDFLGKNITLVSTDPTDWDIVDNTVIRGYVQFSGTEGPNCKFTGFRINDLQNGAIYGNHTHATISYCNISGNGPCGATAIKDCDGIISNCFITDNITVALCGVYPVVFGCNGLIKNCTIVNNVSGVSVGTATIENCIIYNNTGSQLAVTNGNTADISYSNIQNGLAGIASDGQVNWGPGNIDTDPCFVRLGYWIMDEIMLVEGDYHLRSEGWRWNTEGKSWTYDFVTSRCVDAGNPGALLRGELMSVPRDPDNVWGINLRINMGAYGGTSQAGMPPHGWTLLADLNNDGTANFVDFAYQVQDWLITAPEQPGDLNRDGVLNTMDLAALAENWLQVTDWIEW